MKKKIILTTCFSALIILSACENAPDKTGSQKISAGSVSTNNPIENPQINNTAINAIYDQYTALTKALVNEDPNTAKTAANAIAVAATGLKGGQETISSSAQKILNTNDIEDMRMAYSSLSDELIKQIEQAGMEKGALYVDFCPMALQDKGAYWLSSDKEIANPYFGSKMLKCGSISKVIE